MRKASNDLLFIFLSTPSGWRATWAPGPGDNSGLDFYPRPPGGGRLPDLYIMQRGGWISIHALRVEGDRHVEHV